MPADVPVPFGVVTLTVTAPVPAAVTAVIWVAELTTKLAAAVPPNCTAVAPVKPVPVMTTLVPPDCRTGRRCEAGDGRCGQEGEGAGRRAGAVRRRDADGHGTSAGRRSPR